MAGSQARSEHRSPLLISHEDCGGEFFFLKDQRELPETRTCRQCGFVETYERDQLILIGKMGVAQKELKDFCEFIGLKPIEAIKRDRSSTAGSEVYAITVLAADGGRSIDPEQWMGTWLKGKAKWAEKYQQLIYTVCRKPRRKIRHTDEVI